MEKRIGLKALRDKKIISPVREIMSFADPLYIKSIGLDSKDIISFAGGWVNHRAPEELQSAYIDIVKDVDLFHNSGDYSATLGLKECKDAIIEFESILYGMKNLKPSQVAIGSSSTQIFASLLNILTDQDDTIILLDPSYCNYPIQICTHSQAKIERFSVIDPITFQYIAEEKINEFEIFISKHKPKAVILVIPDNPTSKILSDNFINVVYNICKDYNSFLIIDFAYKSFIFNDKIPKYFSQLPDDNFITIHSNSKWSKNLGRRMGWIEAPEFIIEALESMFNSTILCPDTLHQMAFVKFIELSKNTNVLQNYVKETTKLYKATAEYIINYIEEKLKLNIIKPDGGLYILMDVKQEGASFVLNLLKTTGVLLIPGRGFGKSAGNSVRISYGPLVNNFERIELGLKKIKEFINK